MQITFEVELDYGNDGPLEGEATPTKTDVENWVRRGMERDGFTDVEVIVAQL